MAKKTCKSTELRKRPDFLRYIFLAKGPDPRNNRIRFDVASGWDNTNKRLKEGRINGLIICDLINSTVHHLDMNKVDEFMLEWHDNHGNTEWVIDSLYF